MSRTRTVMPHVPWNPFGAGNLRPRRFPRIKRGGKRQPVPKVEEWKIIRGDTVAILAGKDKGKIGEVSEVVRSKNHIYVKGMNTHQRYLKPYGDFPGGLFPSEAPLQLNEVSLIDPKDNEPTDVVYRYSEKGEKVRVSTRSGHIIRKPRWERRDWKIRSSVKDGKFDTDPTTASSVTYLPSLLYFHEEIMKSLDVKPTIPKTELGRRDVIMKEVEKACNWDMQKADIKDAKLSIYERILLFFIDLKKRFPLLGN